MTVLPTPRRQRGIEILDGNDVDHVVRARSHRDIAMSNALFGGTRAWRSELDAIMHLLPPRATLLDIGTGTGEATAIAADRCARAAVQLTTFGLDHDAGLVTSARRHAHHGVCASALALPFPDASLDIVNCAQVAHHFEDAELRQLLREMHRVARLRVIVSDLRRSWAAVAGLWMASFPLRFHPISRHDGVVSILRGFTRTELGDLVYDSVGTRPVVRRHLGFRLSASWSPAHAPTGAGHP
ncbi:MAG: methyltransferase domain-containing protein [Gemmatimonadaceae bacterium]